MKKFKTKTFTPKIFSIFMTLRGQNFHYICGAYTLDEAMANMRKDIEGKTGINPTDSYSLCSHTAVEPHSVVKELMEETVPTVSTDDELVSGLKGARNKLLQRIVDTKGKKLFESAKELLKDSEVALVERALESTSKGG